MDKISIPWLTICVCTCTISGVGTNNIALGKPATQSSVTYGGTANRAVDGNRDSNFWRRSCIHTLHGETDQWWSVDLLSIYRIHTVRIQNRGDDDGFKFHDFEVEVYKQSPGHCPGANKTTCASHPGAANLGENVQLTCAEGTIGRYVKLLKLPQFISSPEDALTICEVEIEGVLVHQCLKDRQFHKHAGNKMQSSNPTNTGLTRAECSRRCYYDNGCYGINIRVTDDECQLITEFDSNTLADDSGWNYYRLC
ncbi:fucolectin-like [Haliotis rufescens]|uniref:fucolectin-like n=1 Tax=Haliotis rufescens TaxID=6454 RepID=UPI001EB08307|nr:fucolectin-like [Haliotis rufescens]